MKMKIMLWLGAALAACGGSSKAAQEPIALCEFVVMSEPTGAEVALNGSPAGQTPLTTKVACGPVKFDLTKVGFKSAGMSVETPDPTKQHQMKVRLEPEDTAPTTSSLE